MINECITFILSQTQFFFLTKRGQPMLGTYIDMKLIPQHNYLLILRELNLKTWSYGYIKYMISNSSWKKGNRYSIKLSKQNSTLDLIGKVHIEFYEKQAVFDENLMYLLERDFFTSFEIYHTIKSKKKNKNKNKWFVFRLYKKKTLIKSVFSIEHKLHM